MHPFVVTISIAGAIVAVIVTAIIAITLFLRVLSWITGTGSKPETIAIRGVLQENVYAKVRLAGGETFERVRLVGYTRQEDFKTRLPYELSGMVILEDERRQRYLVRARDIRMIVVPPDNEPA